jgi:Methyltransferase domain
MLHRFVSKMVHRFLPRYIPASERPEKVFLYPALRPSDIENARLFADRKSLLKHFAPELRSGSVAEVGVMYGDFSDLILVTIEPEVFVAIDRFDLHRATISGKSSSEQFQGMTHREFYERRFSARGKQVQCEEGDSSECLSRYSDSTFAMIYIDAAHDYQSVKKDANLAKQKIKPEGILIFNDYIKYSHYDDSYYGVIPVVNDLVVNQGFEVLGFALQSEMYCDVAIRRKNTRNG